MGPLAKPRSMLVRRLSALALCAIAVTALVYAPVSSASGDKQLARVKGVVGYQPTASGEFKPIFGRLDLPDDAFAVTKPNGEAILRLADSSEIDIGSGTTVQVGAFNAAQSGNANTLVLNNGALHFVIRHPNGAQANYRFVTATSQIAVRGTEGFLIAGANGTQVVCVQCSVGDVSVQVGQQTFSVVTNQTLTVLGSNPLTATTSITSNTAVNNPAVNQFNNGTNPLTSNPTGNAFDPTSSLSGTGTGGATGGLTGGTVGAIAGGTAAVGTAVGVASSNNGNHNNNNNASPAPNVSPPANSAGPLVVAVSFPGANASYPVPFTWPFSQQNATTLAAVTCTPPSVVLCSLTQQIIGTTLSGAINGNIQGPGTFTVSGSASSYLLPQTSFTVYGGVTPSAQTVSFSAVGTSQSITITQAPNGTTLTATASCNGGAAMSLLNSSGQSPWTLTMEATSAPNTSPPPANACVLTIHGQGGTAASTAQIDVNITATGIGVSTHTRKPL